MAELSSVDLNVVKPVRLREPQLRGLAEPFSIVMDFGPLPTEQPLVLALTGWLRFGGGMANVGSSLDSHLPFPFPRLEAEGADGSWKAVPVEVGVPAGKTKTILVDLTGKLPEGARRLRLSTSFELYWDEAVLCSKAKQDESIMTSLSPDSSELRWHGFGRYAPLPDWLPLTPDYDQVNSTPPWSRTPAGWCTRYGAVDELLQKKDDALVLLNGGDEVALSFRADRLPAKPPGFERDYFLYVVGWDKDADFHVAEGWRVEPLPFSGMDDQLYGKLPGSAGAQRAMMDKYKTRWVGPLVPTERRADLRGGHK